MNKVHVSVIKATGAVDRGVKKHPWYEVRMTKCPAILIEIGFLSNAAERKLLMTPEYQNKIARAIADACGQYWIDVLRKAGKNATQPASPLPPAPAAQSLLRKPNTQPATLNAPQSGAKAPPLKAPDSTVRVPAKQVPAANPAVPFVASPKLDFSNLLPAFWTQKIGAGPVVVPKSMDDEEPEQHGLSNKELMERMP